MSQDIIKGKTIPERNIKANREPGDYSVLRENEEKQGGQSDQNTMRVEESNKRRD